MCATEPHEWSKPTSMPPPLTQTTGFSADTETGSTVNVHSEKHCYSTYLQLLLVQQQQLLLIITIRIGLIKVI